MIRTGLFVVASGLLLAACDASLPSTEVTATQIALAPPEERAPLLATAIAQRAQDSKGSLVSEAVALADVRAEGPVVVYEFIIAADVTGLGPAARTQLKSDLRPLFLGALCSGDRNAPSPFDFGVVVRTIIKGIGGQVIDAFDVTEC